MTDARTAGVPAGRRVNSRIGGVLLVLILACAPLAGCVVYEPYPGGSNFDRAWNAALGAVQDAGVAITSSDAGTGLIRGSKDGIDVVVTVTRQADGSVRVQFDAPGAPRRDPGLGERFSRAYDRRMGR